MSILAPVTRTSQPQGPVGIDRSNSLAKNFDKSIVFLPTSRLDIAGSKSPIKNNTTSSVFSKGVSALFPASVSVDINFTAPTLADGVTLVFVGRIDSTATQGLCGLFQSFNGGDRAHYLSVESGGIISALSTDSNNWTAASGPVVVPNSNYTIVGSFTSGGGRKLWVNGKLVATDSTARASSPFTSFLTGIYTNVNDTRTSAMSGHVALSVAVPAVLSDTTCLALSNNPWQIFTPIQRNIYTEAGFAVLSGINLATATTLVGNASSNGVITQTQVLVGSASNQANAAGTGAITQVQTLVAATTSQANASGTGTITLAIQLTGAASSQANTSSTSVITQSHVLVGTASSQAETSSTGVITQTHILVGSASLQANASSTGSIGNAVSLAGAPSAQANASGTGAITQIHVLTVAATSQANAASVAAITQVHSLTAAATAQAQTSLATAITQVHQLIAAATSRANTSSVSAITQVHQLVGSPSSQGNTSPSGTLVAPYFYVPAPKSFTSPARAKTMSPSTRTYSFSPSARSKSMSSPTRAYTFTSPARVKQFTSPARSTILQSAGRSKTFTSPSR